MIEVIFMAMQWVEIEPALRRRRAWFWDVDLGCEAPLDHYRFGLVLELGGSALFRTDVLPWTEIHRLVD
jgi:hypothetical protein